MKRITVALLAIVMSLSFCLTCASGETDRTEFADLLKTYAFSMMKAYYDIYQSNPSDFPDTYAMAAYNYYKLYKTALQINTAEFYVNWGSVGDKLFDETQRKLEWQTSNTVILLESKWNEWMSGDYEGEKFKGLIMIFIEGIINTTDE